MKVYLYVLVELLDCYEVNHIEILGEGSFGHYIYNEDMQLLVTDPVYLLGLYVVTGRGH